MDCTWANCSMFRHLYVPTSLCTDVSMFWQIRQWFYIYNIGTFSPRSSISQKVWEVKKFEISKSSKSQKVRKVKKFEKLKSSRSKKIRKVNMFEKSKCSKSKRVRKVKKFDKSKCSKSLKVRKLPAVKKKSNNARVKNFQSQGTKVIKMLLIYDCHFLNLFFDLLR